MTEKDILIEPRRGKREKPLPQRALMVVNPADAATAFQTFKTCSGETGTLHREQIIVDRLRRLCLAGPALGAPAAVLLLEKLVALGVKDVMLISCCGSLDPVHSIGDLLVGTRAVSGEGVSPYYYGKTVVEPSVSAAAEFREFAENHAINAHLGTVWTTDAPYRERRSELLRLQERYGIVGVDMEFSALCSVASFRDISFGAVFVVSDMLWPRSWKPGFTIAEYKASYRNLIEQLIHDGLHLESVK
jgi:purine-nucleoside phosphorylase